MQKPDGIEFYHTYDPLGRLETLASSDGSINYKYTYNKCHQVTQVCDNINKTSTIRRYDAEGYLKEEILGNGLSHLYDYDWMGRITRLSLPQDCAIGYIYNAAFLKKIERYGQGGLLYQQQNLQHDLSGSVLEKSLIGSSGNSTYSYDLLGRVRSITSAHWKSEVPTHGYDSAGRLVKTSIQDVKDAANASYSYDPLDHLKEEEGHASNRYQTDSIHNRLQKNGQAYHVNAHNRVTERGDSRYVYDLNGNLLEKIKGNERTIYSYDALDRLISVDSPKGAFTYVYDPFHRRISKTSQGETLHYLYQGQNEIGSIHDLEGMKELRILGIGIDAEIGAAVALELNGRVFAPIHDLQGNVACLIDAHTGQAAETYRYSAFGEEEIFDDQGNKITKSSINNPWRFASKRCDEETGWIYFGRRYYDAEIGRWTTPAPLSFTDGPNLYAYLHHNPLNAYDAYGLEGEAYMDSCFVGNFETKISVFSNVDRPDIYSNTQSRSEYISSVFQNASYAVGGSIHGGVNFVTNQMCDLALICCSIGVNEMDDSFEDRRNFNDSFHQSQTKHMNHFDGFVCNSLCDDPNNKIYQSFRSYTTAGLEIGTCAVAGYGIAKGGILVARMAAMAGRAEKMGGKVAAQGVKCGVREGAANVVKTAGRNRLTPNSLAEGAHTVFRRDPVTSRNSKYETYQSQSNLKNPNPWESIKRYDGPGSDRHWNKIMREDIYSPHIHDPTYSRRN